MKNSYPPGFTWLTVRDKKWLKTFAVVTIIWLLTTGLMFVLDYRAEIHKLPTPVWPTILCAVMAVVFLVTAFLTIMTIEPFKPTGPKS